MRKSWGKTSKLSHPLVHPSPLWPYLEAPLSISCFLHMMHLCALAHMLPLQRKYCVHLCALGLTCTSSKIQIKYHLLSRAFPTHWEGTLSYLQVSPRSWFRVLVHWKAIMLDPGFRYPLRKAHSSEHKSEIAKTLLHEYSSLSAQRKLGSG